MNSLSKNYWRVRAGARNENAEQWLKNGYIQIGFGAQEDLTKNVPEKWESFKRMHINDVSADPSAWFPFYILHKFIHDLQEGDIVITPFDQNECIVGEIASETYYDSNDTNNAHKRSIKWHAHKILKENMSKMLEASVYKRGTLHSLTKYANEIEELLQNPEAILITTDDIVENPNVFALEKHMEHFIIENWDNIQEISSKYNLYTSEDGSIGEQVRTDTGYIDILAESKDKKELLVIELKRGRESDKVVGQTQRYMGFIQEEIAKQNQTVKGMIIAFEDDKRIKRALQVAPNIELYTYTVSFNLQKTDKDTV